MRRASARRFGAFEARRAALGVACLLCCASAHVTFKLPSLPGVSPGNAGGYGAPVFAVPDLSLRACGQPAAAAARGACTSLNAVLPNGSRAANR